MSGRLQNGEVSATQSYEAMEYNIPSTDTENQADENIVELVTPARSDLMGPITRSQSSKPTEARSEDNHQPMQKRTTQYFNNELANELQNLRDRFRKERENTHNKLQEIIQHVDDVSSDGMRDVRDQFEKHVECIDRRFAKERNRFEQKINKLKAEISKGAKREKVAAEKITDDTIKSKWNALRYNIRSVVLMLRSCEPKGAKDTPEFLRFIIPESEFKDLPQEYLREILEGYLELYIWKFIYHHVFLGQGRQWRGNIFKLFQMARQEAISTEKDPKKIAEFASWSSQGGEASTSQLDKELQQPMADEFAESIFAMFQSQPKTLYQDDINEVLGVAVYDATELAIMFMSSKALLLPAWPFHRPLENDWPTTDFENERLPNVKSNDRFLVFRPALLKFGNADGENHDVHVILCKPARLYF
ncbi:hypothetical protein ARSEF1564_003391 [Beauveria bassiana]